MEREALRAQRELQKQQRNLDILSARQKAEVEVAAYENELQLLLTLHHDVSDAIDWRYLRSQLPPPAPFRERTQELLALQTAVQAGGKLPTDESLRAAKALDDTEHNAKLTEHSAELDRIRAVQDLAQRVLAGEISAFSEALTDVSGFSELALLGSEITFELSSAQVVSCDLVVQGQTAIPKQGKKLTASGKVSVKDLAKGVFHELFQDYVCSSALRVAREVLALLPVETVIVTTHVPSVSSRTGHEETVPVLSFAATRQVMATLIFEQLDPSDAILNFEHYSGDALASRKAGVFTPIEPLKAEDLTSPLPASRSLKDSINLAVELKTELIDLYPPEDED
jgi:hypothetical protein